MYKSLDGVRILGLTGLVAMISVGQVLLKIASSRLTDRSVLGVAMQVFRDPFMFAALALYFLTTVFWVQTLANVPLRTAYPFVSLGFVFTPLFAYVALGERVGVHYALGTLLICFGLVLTVK